MFNFFTLAHILACMWVISLQFTADFDLKDPYIMTWLSNAGDLDFWNSGRQHITVGEDIA